MIRDDKGCYLVTLDGVDIPLDFSMHTITQFASSKGWRNIPLLEILKQTIENPTYGDAIDFYKMAIDAAWIKHKKKEEKPSEGILADNYFLLFKAAAESLTVFYAKNGLQLEEISKSGDDEKKG